MTRTTDLVAGLRDEGKSWAKKVEEYEKEATTVFGYVLLAAAFVSYASPFTSSCRASRR